MKCKIIAYEYRSNRAVIEFDTDFSEAYEKYKDKALNIEIKLWRLKRSLASNRYMWKIIDMITRKTRLSKSEIYRNEVKEIGGVSDIVELNDEAVEKFCRYWEAQGLGWQTEVIGSENGKTAVIAYYGSSTFDSEQMSRLIENLQFEAQNLGINTDTPERQAWLESLLEEGDKMYGNKGD